MFHPVFKTGSRRIKPAVAGSIPAPSAIQLGNIMQDSIQQELRKLPGVDKLLNLSGIRELVELYGRELVSFSLRKCISYFREIALQGESIPSEEFILQYCITQIKKIGSRSLKAVFNASGIIIHTNLGRAPFGEELILDSLEVLKGYNNLEFDLQKGARGQRNDHASDILQFLTGAEDIVVVNNNAAAVMLILRTFAKGKEAIVSRGELIEIGGSFRIPEIMAASDCKMVEVGATNKTKVSDYEKAINQETALLFKTHTSNYVIKGFTHEVGLDEMVALGKKHQIPVVYDIGSGLLRKVNEEALKNEPDVKEALATGIDLICFSGDKLLGGPQAGIIAGKKKYIELLKKAPMMRALRVGKATLAMLEKACSYYLNDEKLFKHNILFKTLNRKQEEIRKSAEQLQGLLREKGMDSQIVSSKGQYGGGTMPDLDLDSCAVLLELGKSKSIGRKMYHELLDQEPAILSNLKSGQIHIDMLCLQDSDISQISELISSAHQNICS